MKRSCLAFLLFAAGCANTSYLARVNGEQITSRDLKREFGLRHASMEKYLAGDEEVRKYLDNAIDRRLLVQEAERIGLQDLPEVKAVLAETHASLMIRLLLKNEIEDKKTATDAEVATAYAQSKELLRVRHVALATQEEAEKVRARILAGEDIGELAKSLSTASTAKDRGLLVVTWGYDEPWETHVLPLAAGELSPVFKSKNGWEVVRVEERVKNELPAFEKAKARLQGRIEQRKRLAREHAFLDEMRTKYAARRLECDVSVAALRKAVDAKDATPCATYTGGTLTRSDIASRLDLDLLAAEPADRYPASIDLAISDLLSQEYLLAEATARGYAATREVGPEEATRRERLLHDLLLERYVLVDATPSEDEVRKHIAEHAEDQIVPEARVVARFAVRSQEEVDAVRRKLADGEDFGEVQAKAPVVPGSSGSVQVKKGDPSPEAAPVFAAKKNEVVGPVSTKGAFFFVKVLDIIPERTMPEKEAFQQTQQTASRAARTRRPR